MIAVVQWSMEGNYGLVETNGTTTTADYPSIQEVKQEMVIGREDHHTWTASRDGSVVILVMLAGCWRYMGLFGVGPVVPCLGTPSVCSRLGRWWAGSTGLGTHRLSVDMDRMDRAGVTLEGRSQCHLASPEQRIHSEVAIGEALRGPEAGHATGPVGFEIDEEMPPGSLAVG